MRTFGSSGQDARDLDVAREEIAQLRVALERARDETTAKEREIRELNAAVRRLEIRLGEMKQGGEFVESHGVLWQRSAGGHIEPLAYCPDCRLVMTPLPSGYPEYLVCTNCTFRAPFLPDEIPYIMGKLRGQFQ